MRTDKTMRHDVRKHANHSISFRLADSARPHWGVRGIGVDIRGVAVNEQRWAQRVAQNNRDGYRRKLAAQKLRSVDISDVVVHGSSEPIPRPGDCGHYEFDVITERCNGCDSNLVEVYPPETVRAIRAMIAYVRAKVGL